MTLTFTKLPTPAGNIKIEEITLTQEQIKQTGSLSDKAYDITSDMTDGSFTYNLSLPIPESSKGKAVDVKFAEELSNIGTAEKVENTLTKTDTSVSVASLDHFTFFVVSSPVLTGSACTTAGATNETSCYSTIQAAIDAANLAGGDTINLTSDITATATVVVNRAVTINGGSHTLTFTGLESVVGDVDDGFMIQAPTTINDLIVNAGLATPTSWVGTYAIQVYHTTATLNNVTATHANGGILGNNSTVTLTGAINVSGNGYGGIESTGASASLNVSGVSWTNASEAYGKPTIWEDGVTGTTVINYGVFTRIIKGAQYQYYLTAGNSVAPTAHLVLTVPAARTITRYALVPETSGVPTAGNAAVNTAIVGLTPIAVTLENTGGAASANVRISPINAGSHIQLWAKDTSDNWFDINVTGWIDSAGKSISANSGPITTSVYAISDTTGDYPLTVNLVNAVGGTHITSTTGTVTVTPIIHTLADFKAFDGVNIGTNSYTLSSSITRTYTGNNTIKLTGYAPIVTPWFMPDWTTYNYVTIGIKLPVGFSGNTTVFSTGVMKYYDSSNNPVSGYYYMGSGSTPLATTGAALGYLDFSFGANKNYVKDGLVKLSVIWNIGDTPEDFTIDITDLQLTPAVPTLESPADGVYRHTSDPNFSDWSDVTNPLGVGYRYQSASDIGFSNLLYDSNDHGPLLVASTILNPGEPEISYFWRVQACDTVRNCSDWSTPRKINIDNTIPALVITIPTTNQIIMGRLITINGTATDTNFNYYYCYVSNVNGHEYGARDASCTTTWHAVTPASVLGSVTLPNDLPDDNYVVHLIGYDKAGNSAEATKQFVLDNTAPNANITSPLAGGYVRGTIDITGAFSDNNHEFNSIYMGFTGNDKNENQLSWCHSEAPGFGITDGTRTCSFDTTKLSDGSHKIEIWAMDKAGNWGTGSNQSINVMVDNTAPIININTFITNDSTPKLTGTVNDNTATISIEVDGKTFTDINNNNGTWELIDNTITPALVDGTYSVIASATDTAGNIGVDSSTNELTIDTVAPTATHKYYKNGTEVSGLVSAQNVSELTFDSTVTDNDPSSGLKYETFSIFKANGDGSFGWNTSYCGFRQPANTYSLSGTVVTITDKKLTDCVASLADGEYYVMHGEYDNAARGNDNVVTQYSDSLGLHFIVDSTTPATPNLKFSFNTSTSSDIGGAVLGAASAPVCNDQKPSSAPILLSAVAGANSVTLTWSVASNPTSYYLVTYGDKPGSQQYGNPNIGPTGTTSYTVNSLSGNTTYYFKVRAGNGCTPGDFSNELSATTTALGQFIATPAAGFQEGVLGAQTTATPSTTLNADTTANKDTVNIGDILGTQKTAAKGFDWRWLWLLLIPAAGILIYSRRRSN